MFIDTSAIIEALIAGPQAANLVARHKTTSTPWATMPTVIYEATVVLANKRNVAEARTEEVFHDFSSGFDIAVIPVLDQYASFATDGFGQGLGAISGM